MDNTLFIYKYLPNLVNCLNYDYKASAKYPRSNRREVVVKQEKILMSNVRNQVA